MGIRVWLVSFIYHCQFHFRLPLSLARLHCKVLVFLKCQPQWSFQKLPVSFQNWNNDKNWYVLPYYHISTSWYIFKLERGNLLEQVTLWHHIQSLFTCNGLKSLGSTPWTLLRAVARKKNMTEALSTMKQLKDFAQKWPMWLFGQIFIFRRIKLIFGRLACFDMKSIVA